MTEGKRIKEGTENNTQKRTSLMIRKEEKKRKGEKNHETRQKKSA